MKKQKTMKKLYTTLILCLAMLSVNGQTSLTTAVDFTVTDVHGDTHNLFNYLNEGKHVIVDFFFTTCGPCIASVPTLNAAYTNYGCNTAEVIFLSMDNGDSDAAVLQYESDYNGLLPSISGVDGGGDAVNTAYGIGAYPTVILIAPDRSIVEQDIYPVSNITTALPAAGLNMSACTATGIEKINISTIHTKSTIVDVLGRKWNTSYNEIPKGVYIIDGKKVLKTE